MRVFLTTITKQHKKKTHAKASCAKAELNIIWSLLFRRLVKKNDFPYKNLQCFTAGVHCYRCCITIFTTFFFILLSVCLHTVDHSVEFQFSSHSAVGAEPS